MTDVAKIRAVNVALLALGKPTVTGLSEADQRLNQSAAKIARVLDTCRLNMLERHGWLCAMSYACLQPVVIPNDVNWKYSAVYALPKDYVALWDLRVPQLVPWFAEIDWSTFGLVGPPVLNEQAWEINTLDDTTGGSMTVLRCNLCAGVAIAYTRRANWEALSPQLLDAIGWDAAQRVAYNVTGDQNQADKLSQRAERAIDLAIGKDATQEGGQNPIAPSVPERIRAISR